ncbi:1602_t:CDS:2 [Diversispora eburnea]|uniref:1602_t:CDS:1 n=1 Tax=Diversispora eburnea TaxID=1213867 RepID=A0A9N8V0V6_9GLOM|nr:1602_t:CDS:2 [Diversispora eburnea]
MGKQQSKLIHDRSPTNSINSFEYCSSDLIVNYPLSETEKLQLASLPDLKFETIKKKKYYPQTKFTGIDIAPIFPTSVKPQNVEFIQANILKGLPFKDNTFDFVMIRLMIFAFTIDEWEKAVKEAVRVCKVGGWIEMMEKDILFFGAGRIANGIQHWQRNVPFGGNLGKSYSEIYAWGAKNLKNVIKNECRNDQEWDEVVDKVIDELSSYGAYDKIHRFWGIKIDENTGNIVNKSLKDGETLGVINGVKVIEVL